MHAADDDLMRNQADREKEFSRREQMRCIRQHRFDGNRNRAKLAAAVFFDERSKRRFAVNDLCAVKAGMKFATATLRNTTVEIMAEQP
jgi:hypothetical protein